MTDHDCTSFRRGCCVECGGAYEPTNQAEPEVTPKQLPNSDAILRQIRDLLNAWYELNTPEAPR